MSDEGTSYMKRTVLCTTQRYMRRSFDWLTNDNARNNNRTNNSHASPLRANHRSRLKYGGVKFTYGYDGGINSISILIARYVLCRNTWRRRRSTSRMIPLGLQWMKSKEYGWLQMTSSLWTISAPWHTRISQGCAARTSYTSPVGCPAASNCRKW